MTLNIFLFGTPYFERTEKSLHVSRRKCIALVSYLACTDRPCSRETLATLLWPEHDQAAALKSLRRELARVKQALGSQTISASRAQLWFNHEVDVRVDVVQFQDLLQRVREHDNSPEPCGQACPEMLTTAADLYHDEFMAGFNLPDCPDFDRWQSLQRENLRHALGYALRQLAIFHANRQEHERALDYGRRWLELDPLDEAARRMLMQIYAQAGQKAAALRLYEEGVQVLKDELGIAPSEESTRLREAICAGRFPKSTELPVPLEEPSVPEATSPRARRRSNLPPQPTPFIGRTRELTMIRMRLREPACRLLTLVGPGGIGKTRLAIEVAYSILDAGVPFFADGIFFVPLTEVNQRQGIVSAINEAVGYVPYSGPSLEQQLLEYLQEKQMLFILDNLEHLSEGVDIITAILATAPGVKIVTTSLAALRLQEEWFHPVGGLSVPPPDFARSMATHEAPSSHDYDAVQLFEQCAVHASPDFSLDEEMEHVVRICRMVEGMPLALELAAAWLKVLDAQAVADGLEQSSDLLASRFRNLPARHQSIRAVFDHTWSMLKPVEQKVLARLSVFRSDFSQVATTQIAGATVFMLSALVEKSLLQTKGHGRYRLHELLRQFAAEKLEGMGQVHEIREVHSQYYLAKLEQLEPEIKGVHQRTAIKQIKGDLDNIRHAWNWALEQGDTAAMSQTLESVFLYFFVRGRNQEGINFLQPACNSLAPRAGGSATYIWGRIVSRLSLMKSYLLPPTDIRKELEVSLAIAQKQQDPLEIAFCHFVQGQFYTLVRNDATAAIRAFELARQTYHDLNESFYLIQVLIWMGFSYGNNSRLDLYFELTREALELAQTNGHKAGAAHALGNLVAGAFCVGDYATAEEYAYEVAAIGEELDLPNTITHSKTQLCLVHFLKGEIDLAWKLAKEARELAQEIHYPPSIAYTLTFLSLCESITGDYLSAKKLGEESLATPSPRFGEIMAQWAVAIACCGLEQDEEGWRHAFMMLELAHRAGFSGMTTWPLPVMAIILARADQEERAIELLALAQSHPLSPTGWQDRWSLLGQLYPSLEAGLGTASYRAAWERGRQLQPEAVLAWEPFQRELQ